MVVVLEAEVLELDEALDLEEVLDGVLEVGMSMNIFMDGNPARRLGLKPSGFIAEDGKPNCPAAEDVGVELV